MELTGNAAKKLDEIANAVDKVGSKFENGMKGSVSAFKIFEGTLAADLAMKGLEKLADAAGALFDTFIKDGVKAATEEADAINRLNTSLALSGNYSAKASQGVIDFASELQKSTRYADDAIISAAGLLGSMARLDENGLKRGTEAAANLASALRIDLDSAVRLVGKAAEGNVDAFKRYGVEIQKGATDSQTFANTLDTLNARFGGAAKADADTYSGAMDQLGNVFGDLQESIGNIIVQNPVMTQIIKAGGEALQDVTAWVNDNSESLKRWVGEGIVGAVAGLRELLAITNAITFGKFDTQLLAIDEALLRMGMAADVGMAKLATGASTAAPAIKSSTASVVELTEAQKKQIETGDKLIEQNQRKSLSTQEALAADLEAVNAAEAQKLIGLQEGTALRLQIETDALAARQQLYTDAYTKEIEELQARNAILAEERTFDAQAQIEQNNAVIAAKTAGLEKGSLKAQEIGKKQADFEKRLNTERLQATAGIFGNLTTLAQAAGKDGFEIAKVTGIAQAGALGILAVQQALASAPPPFNFALAATVGAVAALNVAKIASSQPPSFASGLENVPAGFEGDNFPAYLQTNEAVLNRGDNSKLARIADESDGTRAVLSKILSVLERGQTIMIDGREVFSVLRDQQAGGRVFA